MLVQIGLLLEIVVAVVEFFLLQYIVYLWTEKNLQYPEWLEYKPWCCRLCLGFWLPVGFFLAVGLTLHLYLMMATGLIITVLNTIAYYIHENNHKLLISKKNEDDK